MTEQLGPTSAPETGNDSIGGSSDQASEERRERARQAILRSDDSSPGWYLEPQDEERTIEGRGSDSRAAFTRVSLGSALLAIDALNERLEGTEEGSEGEETESRTLEAVLVPQGEWEERFGQAPGLAARHLAIGVAIDAKSRVSRGLSLLNRAGNMAVRVMEAIFEPITRSNYFRPVRKQFNAAVHRGENQVNFWMNLGRAEDARSRQLAETALNQVMDESMDEIVDNQRVQEFVQEMLAVQSLGIIDEAIEEMRERAVSSDTFFEQSFRRLLRKEHRRTIPGPAFDRRLVRPMSKRSAPIDRGSLLGYYAGFVSRLLALAIDVGLVILFMAMTGWIMQTIGRFLDGTTLIASLALTDQIVKTIGIIFASLNATTVIIAYAFIFWILTGQTPGMMLLGLRVVSTDGEHLTFSRAVLRLFGYILSIAALFLGFLWVLFDDRRQGWHDKLAGTYVVYSWDAHPDETFLTTFM